MTNPIHPLAGTVEEVRAFEAASAPAAVAVPAGWKLVPVQVPDSAFPWVSGGYSADYRARDPRDQKIIEERAQRTWAAILDGIAAAPAAGAPAYFPTVESLPEWAELSERVDAGESLPPLEQFVYDNEEAGEGAEAWRRSVVEMVQHYASPAAPAPVVLPSGWVPCIVTYEGQHPEEVAYGPQVMMDRLKKWLERYFELKAAAPVVLPEPVAWAISNDGKTPYSLWTEGDGALLDTEIKRLGGTARKMPLYAAPAADALDAVTIPVSALRDLRKDHIYMGLCPEDSQPDSRDPDCPCCKATVIVDAAIAAQAAAKGRDR